MHIAILCISAVAICTERVEAKLSPVRPAMRDRVAICTERVEAKNYPNSETELRASCNLHGACGGKDCVKPVSDTLYRCNLHGACGGKGLNPNCSRSALSCNLHGACGGKDNDEIVALVSPGCNLHGACGGKVSGEDIHFVNLLVAICTERVEDLASSLEKNPRKFMQTYCIFIHFGV